MGLPLVTSAVSSQLSNCGKTSASRSNVWDASSTSSGIKRECYEFIKCLSVTALDVCKRHGLCACVGLYVTMYLFQILSINKPPQSVIWKRATSRHTGPNQTFGGDWEIRQGFRKRTIIYISEDTSVHEHGLRATERELYKTFWSDSKPGTSRCISGAVHIFASLLPSASLWQ
jgi:hypothetical protein